MAIPDPLRSQIEARLARFCARKAPPEVSEQLRLVTRLQGDAVTLHEKRPAIGIPGAWIETKVARIRYDAKGRRWTLESAGAGGRWRAYRGAGPLPSLDAAIAEIDRDPTGVFWG